MIQSMTGFATKTITLSLSDKSKINVSLSLKSLNSRFFETTCKLPYALSNLETELVKLFKKKLLRGQVYFTIQLSNQAAFKGAVEPSLNVIENYLQAIKTIKEKFKLQGEMSLSDLLQLPNVITVEDRDLDDASKQKIWQATDELIDEVIAARNQEGAALKKDLEQRIIVMQQEIDQIEKASLILIEEQKNKVNQAIQEIELDESKLAETRKNALYAILDKMDIHEEIVRFQSHLKNLGEQLKASSVENGKRIDFTLQELAREVNTITAKCSDAAIGTRAINIKVELEKAREQAQNIV